MEHDEAIELKEIKEEDTSPLDDIVANLTYKELHELRDNVTSRMTEMRNSGITQLRATIAEQATILGVDIADLVPKKQRRKRRTKAEMETAE